MKELKMAAGQFHFLSLLVVTGFIVMARAHDNDTERLLEWMAPDEFEAEP